MSKTYIIKHEDGQIEFVNTQQQFMDIITDKSPQPLPELAEFQDSDTGWIADVDGVMQ